MSLPEFSVSRRVTITMLILIVALFGVIFFPRLGMELMPEIGFPMVAIVTQYEGVAPEDIEKSVTRSIEAAVSNIQGVENIRSTSTQGTSSVQVAFDWDTNIDLAAQDVRDSLSMMSEFLPDDAKDPIVLKFDLSAMPIIFYVVTGIKDTMVMRKYLEDIVQPRVERIAGVAIAAPMGGLTREILISVRHDELSKRGLSIDQLVAALRMGNLNVSGGLIVDADSEHLIRTIGEFEDLDEIRETVVFARGDVRVLIRDVAEVIDTHREIRQYVRAGGEPAVLFMVMKRSGANTVTTARAVRKELEEIKEVMPALQFRAVMDQAEIIEQVVSKTSANAYQGAILAVLFIAIFLWSLRATVTIAVAIPLAIMTTFIGMYAIGYTFNLLTLGGLALGVGMLVDNAVVVIENTFRHLEKGESPAVSAAKGAEEVSMAITASTLTTMSVFLPMIIVGGLAGKFTQPLALTVCVALLASLFVAITLVPAIAATLFHSGKADEYRKRFEEGWFMNLAVWYRGTVSAALRHPLLVIGTALAMFGGSIFVLYRVGVDFVPSQDVPMAFMQARMPVGTTLEETNRAVVGIEKAAALIPGIKLVAAMVGSDDENAMMSADGQSSSDVNEAMIFMRLENREDRELGSLEIEDRLRAAAPNVPGGEFNFMQLGMASAGTGAEQTPVAIRVFGPDLKVLGRLGRDIRDRITTVTGLRDVRLDTEQGKPEFRISLDRKRAAEKGLSVYQVASTVRAAVQGVRATVYRTGGEEFTIRVRFREADRDTLAKIKAITIPAPAIGQPGRVEMVRLGDIAEISVGTGPLAIRREGRERKVAVTAAVTGRDLGTIMKEVDDRLADLDVPTGYTIDYGGTYQDMQETMASLGWAFLAAMLLVYMILAAQFESLVQPFIIMFTVPLGVIGIAVGLGAMGMSLSMPAMLGGCILVGIVVNNAIVMIDHINRLRRDGMEFREAIVQGATDRLRPILVTSLTTILGILPMGLSTSQGAEMRAPMGIAIAGGLTFGMLLTLFVIPVAYKLMARKSRARMA